MRTIEATLTWPDATAARATLRALSPELGARVDWTGDAARIASLPADIAPGAGGDRCSVGSLLAFAQQHAAATGAEFGWTSEGAYEIWAE